MRRTRGEMTQQRGKKIGLPHPAVAFAAAGLLLGVTFNEMIRPAPRTSVASVPPGGLPPAAAAPPAARSGMAASFAGPPAPALPAGGDEPRTPGADLPALPPAPRSAATSPPALVGPPAPARGPDWKRAPLPAVSPEVLQAMLNPRAVRRARHLLRLGLVPPPEPASPQEGSLAMAQHRIAGPAHPKGAAAAAAAPVPRPVGSHPPSGYAAAGAEAPVPTAITKRERPEPASHEFGSLTPASPATPADPGGKSAAAQPTGASGSTPHEAKPDGESGGKEAAADGRTAAPAADRAPIRLQARLNHPRSEYRVGEWVAVRFLASQPVHLRV